MLSVKHVNFWEKKIKPIALHILPQYPTYLLIQKDSFLLQSRVVYQHLLAN